MCDYSSTIINIEDVQIQISFSYYLHRLYSLYCSISLTMYKLPNSYLQNFKPKQIDRVLNNQLIGHIHLPHLLSPLKLLTLNIGIISKFIKMFDPSKVKKDKEEKAEKAKVINTLRDWSLTIIPIEHQEHMDLDIREVICGDPTCAPIDTVFTMVWPNGGKGIFALPLSPSEISQDELVENFPVSMRDNLSLSPLTYRILVNNE